MNGRDESCRESSPSCFFVAQKLFWSPNFPENSPIRHLKTLPGKQSQGKTPVETGKTPKTGTFFFDKEAGAKARVVGRCIFGGFPFFFWPKKKLLGMTNFFPEIQDQMVRRLVNLSRRMGWNHPSYTIIDRISTFRILQARKKTCNTKHRGHPSPISVEKKYHPRCGNTQQKSAQT